MYAAVAHRQGRAVQLRRKALRGHTRSATAADIRDASLLQGSAVRAGSAVLPRTWMILSGSPSSSMVTLALNPISVPLSPCQDEVMWALQTTCTAYSPTCHTPCVT